MTNPVNEYHGYAAPVIASRGQDPIDEDGNNTALPIFSYYEHHRSTSEVHVYLSQNIGAPAAYIPLIQMLNSRAPGDVVHLHINSYGGRLDAGIQILTAMRTSNAQIIGYLEGAAYSMAALLFLACDGHGVSPYGKLMLHTYSGGGGGGKAPDQRAAMAAVDDTYARLVQDICVPFLTKKEVKDMLENMKDLYFGYDEIIERMNPQPKAKPKSSRKVKPVTPVEKGLPEPTVPEKEELVDVVEGSDPVEPDNVEDVGGDVEGEE